MDKYSKEMETLMIKAIIVEEEEQTIARFLCGLNKELVDVVELQPYTDLNNLMNLAIKVERQRGQKWGNNKPNSNPNNKWGIKCNTKAKFSLDPKKIEKTSP